MTEEELTKTEIKVLEVMRWAPGRPGRVMSTFVIRGYALDRLGVSYDRVHHGLRGLAAKGYVERVMRGAWALTVKGYPEGATISDGVEP